MYLLGSVGYILPGPLNLHYHGLGERKIWVYDMKSGSRLFIHVWTFFEGRRAFFSGALLIHSRDQ